MDEMSSSSRLLIFFVSFTGDYDEEDKNNEIGLRKRFIKKWKMQ